MAALLKSAESKDFVGSNPTLSAKPEVPVTGPPPGLCGACRHSRVIRTARGSIFRLCERSTTDPRFPRYPNLPVLECVGFEPIDPVPGVRPSA
jgi:hypothetical protein